MFKTTITRCRDDYQSEPQAGVFTANTLFEHRGHNMTQIKSNFFYINQPIVQHSDPNTGKVYQTVAGPDQAHGQDYYIENDITGFDLRHDMLIARIIHTKKDPMSKTITDSVELMSKTYFDKHYIKTQDMDNDLYVERITTTNWNAITGVIIIGGGILVTGITMLLNYFNFI